MAAGIAIVTDHATETTTETSTDQKDCPGGRMINMKSLLVKMKVINTGGRRIGIGIGGGRRTGTGGVMRIGIGGVMKTGTDDETISENMIKKKNCHRIILKSAVITSTPPHHRHRPPLVNINIGDKKKLRKVISTINIGGRHRAHAPTTDGGINRMIGGRGRGRGAHPDRQPTPI